MTREGKNVRILCTDRKLDSAEVIGLAMNNDGTEGLISCSKQGKSFILNDSSFDLFFAPEKHERWVNLYKSGLGDYSLGRDMYISKERAESVASGNCVSTVKIEWEE